MMYHFLEKIEKQLKIMSEKEKEAWIISQAKIISEWEQEDFYKSLCGTKKVIYMPERQEIDNFCERVKLNEIAIEYETHYVEFDDYGYYHDDWEETFHDPSGAMRFIASVIRGCHDLVILEEYTQAFEILDEMIGLKFIIKDHPDTDDTCQNEFFTLRQAVSKGMLSINCEEVLGDYIEACENSVRDVKEAARKIISAFEMKLFEKCKPYVCMTLTEKDPILNEMKNILDMDLKKAEQQYAKKSKVDPYYPGYYNDEMFIRQIHSLIEDFGKIGMKDKKTKESFLSGTWKQIKKLIDELSYERYIDDQFQIEEIYNIVEALIKRGGFEKEPWEIKEMILKEIYENGFYDIYGVYDPMSDLANAICVTKDENLKRAEIMMNVRGGYFGSEAAKLYRELGEAEKCAEYFEKHLGKDEEAYEIVMDYYKKTDYPKAVEIARLAISKCKEDQTSFFKLLLQDAKDRGDEAEFKKLMQSVHRRRSVNSREIDAIWCQTQ